MAESAEAREGKQTRLEFYASCPEGFEAALANELRALGARSVRRLKGRVAFMGRASDAYRACLHSRLASRVFLVIGRIGAGDADTLYAEAALIPWERILREGASLAVNARGVNEGLRNSHFTALKVKDAICDRMAACAGARPVVDTEAPDARVSVSVRQDRAGIDLDLSGDPLFKRLPREAARVHGAHVLRPDYAALLLTQAGWADACRDFDGVGPVPALADISCAGGGIELEAASMLASRAPGRDRVRWGFEGWAGHDPNAWRALLAQSDEEARGRQEAVGACSPIIAADMSAGSIELARRLARKTGAARYVTYTAGGLGDALGRPGASLHAVVGDLLETPSGDIPGALAALRDAARHLDGGAVALLSRDGLTMRALGCEPSETLRVMPGNEEARILTFASASLAVDDKAGRAGATVDLGDGKPLPVLVPESEQFARRLRKVARLRRKWAAREGVTCYRVYDADLPDYSAAIDLYTGSAATPGRWLVIAEYAAPKSVDPELARARFLDILAIAPRILEVEPDHIHAKARMRSRGGSQYGKQSKSQDRAESFLTRPLPLIEEGGLTFAVNFDDYLDTGIFLDHRVTRSLVREHARGKRWFLNLFAYTGTATCYAADAGVEETVTVDMSNSYLDWAERNMRQNGFTGPEHHFVRDDVLGWVDAQIRRGMRWDLIFCDPPTFSNSSKMGARTFDVQRDHVWLLGRLADLLTEDGEAIFSCNLRTFKPDAAALKEEGAAIEDISARTIPEDFSRNPKIHRCYIVRRTGR